MEMCIFSGVFVQIKIVEMTAVESWTFFSKTWFLYCPKLLLNDLEDYNESENGGLDYIMHIVRNSCLDKNCRKGIGCTC